MVKNEDEAISCLLRYYEKNDRQALGEFSRYYFPYIYRTAQYYVSNKDDIEDICQQVFVRLMDRKATCEGVYEKAPKKVRTWLGAVCANIAKNLLRQNKNMKKRITNYSSKLEKRQETDHADHHLSDKLAEMLNLLPLKYRAPLMLRYKEELSFNEISDILGVKPITIRSQISRGIQFLKQRLEEQKITLSAALILKLISSQKLEASNLVVLEKCLQTQLSTSTSSIIAVANFSASKIAINPLFIGKLALFILLLLSSYFGIQYFKTPAETQNTTKKKESLLIEQDNKQVAELPQKSVWQFKKDTIENFVVTQGSLIHDQDKGVIKELNEGKTSFIVPYQYREPILVRMTGDGSHLKNRKRFFINAYPAKNPKYVNGGLLINDLNIEELKLRNEMIFTIYIFDGYVINYYKKYDGVAIFYIDEEMKNSRFLINLEGIHIKSIEFFPIHLEDKENILKRIQGRSFDQERKKKLIQTLNEL